MDFQRLDMAHRCPSDIYQVMVGLEYILGKQQTFGNSYFNCFI
jgi:hypothetical protein